jgi:hypothetical protein
MKRKSSRRFSKKYKYKGRGPSEWFSSIKGKMSSLNPFKAKPCEPQGSTMQGPPQDTADIQGTPQDTSEMQGSPQDMSGMDPSQDPGMTGGRRRTRCNRRRRSRRR